MNFASFVRLAAFLFAAACPVSAQVYEGKTLVEPGLVADTTAIVPGRPFRAGLLLKMAPHWHTYWQYAGDAGVATRIEWALPEGFGAGPIEWPMPEGILEPGDIQVYAYGDEVLLMATIQPPAGLKPDSGPVTLRAKATWLVCEEICIPGGAELSITLPVAGSAAAANAELFAKYEARLPSPEAPPFPVRWSGEGRNWIAQVEPGEGVGKVEFFPLPGPNQAVGHPVVSGDGKRGYSISIEAEGVLNGVLAVEDSGGRHGWMVSSEAGSGAGEGSRTVPQARDRPYQISIWMALFYGVLGGLILNLMPCVLPVISLKIFGFINQAGEAPRRILLHGLAFTGGIFVWFLGLAAVVAALKMSGSQVTWAFQFQNPWFIFAIAIIVFVFALNLFGVFEIVLPGRTSNRLSELGARSGYRGSFFQGVFATLLATPCTGPFLGLPLGFAFSQPPVFIFAMFGAVALGMALPYLILSARPGWMRFLPKPGAWMERLKQFMGFPLLATLVWLLWIIGGQKGLDGVMWTAAFLTALGLACWIYGAFCGPMNRKTTHGVALAAIVIIVGAGSWLFVGEGFAKANLGAGAERSVEAGGIPWVPYSAAKVEELLAAGEPVFIDFTADWCITCKFNERTAIDRPAVRKLIEEKGIVPVKADWTNSNPEITAALEKFGRVGVPFYVLYPAGRSGEPVTLPELLTEQMVLDALKQAR